MKTKLEACAEILEPSKAFRVADVEQALANLKPMRRGNALNAFDALMKSRFDFVIKSHYHLRVEDIIDFWPSSGKWMDKREKKVKHGIKALLNELERRIPND